MTSVRLLSWGNYPPFPQIPLGCHWRGDLSDRLDKAKRTYGTTLPYGSGMSYGDSCLASSNHVLYLRPLNRFISAEWDTGVLTAEAGVSLEEILAVTIPRGWFLPVTPGTKYVTLGGAIANDVHGKNHHVRGTFGRHLRRFGLLRSDAGRVTCTPNEQADLFNATIGGLGLTGLIEWAEIQLVPIRSSQVNTVVQRFGDLGEYFAVSAELDEKHEFSVSWVDCAARGKSAGRGVYTAGDFATEGTLEVENPRKFTIPGMPPLSLVNSMTLRAFNSFYWHRRPRGRAFRRMGYGAYFYPLDLVLKWNRLYGAKGLQQYQCVIPQCNAPQAILAMLAAIARANTGSFLAVLKRCGSLPSPGLLSFPMSGTTLALDFPQDNRLESTLFPRLDSIVREAGGRLYPAKDAHMSGEDFRKSYPGWSQVEALRDPLLLSRFWCRVSR